MRSLGADDGYVPKLRGAVSPRSRWAPGSISQHWTGCGRCGGVEGKPSTGSFNYGKLTQTLDGAAKTVTLIGIWVPLTAPIAEPSAMILTGGALLTSRLVSNHRSAQDPCDLAVSYMEGDPSPATPPVPGKHVAG